MLVPSTHVSQLPDTSATPGEPHPRVPDSVGLGWSLSLHLSKVPSGPGDPKRHTLSCPALNNTCDPQLPAETP